MSKSKWEKRVESTVTQDEYKHRFSKTKVHTGIFAGINEITTLCEFDIGQYLSASHNKKIENIRDTI
jgi:hypothetical protein